MGNTTLKLKRTAMIITFMSILLGAFVMHAETPSQKAQHAKEVSKKSVEEAGKKAKALKLEPWEAWDKYREQMITISRQMGVTCTHCHDTKNYRDASKKTHQIAKAHMEMVDMINDKYKNSFSEKVDCYMCHKGVAKPEFKEKKEKF